MDNLTIKQFIEAQMAEQIKALLPACGVSCLRIGVTLERITGGTEGYDTVRVMWVDPESDVDLSGVEQIGFGATMHEAAREVATAYFDEIPF